MIKSAKWCFGIALSLGLSACNMFDMQSPERVDTRYRYGTMNPQQQVTTTNNTNSKSKPVQKTYATKDPTQKATPGPTRKAAPQLPVIQ